MTMVLLSSHIKIWGKSVSEIPEFDRLGSNKILYHFLQWIQENWTNFAGFPGFDLTFKPSNKKVLKLKALLKGVIDKIMIDIWVRIWIFHLGLI